MAVCRVTVQEVDGCSGYCCPTGNSRTSHPPQTLLPFMQHTFVRLKVAVSPEHGDGFHTHTLSHRVVYAGETSQMSTVVSLRI